MALRRWIPTAMLVAVCISLVIPLSARADGVIIVEPPQCDPACPGPTYIGDQLIVRSHKVDVTIDNQLATTRIDQVFFNPNDWVAEGTYIFPIPEGATVDEVASAMGWQRHTVRGLFSGTLKKKLGLTLASAQEERGRVYRITEPASA